MKCPKCSSFSFWRTSDGRLKCKNCRYLFTPKSNPLSISNQLLEELINEFILEHSTNIILERVKISKYKLLKTFNFFRKAIARELGFSGIKLNLEKIKEPVFGIFFQEGKILSEVLPIDGKILSKRIKKFIWPEEIKKYQGIILNRNFYRSERGRKINIVENFWGYLKRRLFSKGGIKKEKLPLYLAEYSWRYNNRKLSLKEKKERLVKILSKNF